MKATLLGAAVRRSLHRFLGKSGPRGHPIPVPLAPAGLEIDVALKAPDRRLDGVVVRCPEPALTALFDDATAQLLKALIAEDGGAFRDGTLFVRTLDERALAVAEALGVGPDRYPELLLAQARSTGGGRALNVLLTRFPSSPEARAAAPIAAASPRVELQALGAVVSGELEVLQTLAAAGTLRGAALEILPLLLPNEAAGLLVEGLLNCGYTHRESLATALTTLPLHRAKSAWSRLLQSDDPAIVLDAAEALGRLDGGTDWVAERTLPHLRAALKRPDAQTRVLAQTVALAKVRAAGPLLVDGLDTPRSAGLCGQALQLLADPYLEPRLLERLARKPADPLPILDALRGCATPYSMAALERARDPRPNAPVNAAIDRVIAKLDAR